MAKYVKITTNNVPLAKSALQAQTRALLEAWGQQGVSYAKKNITSAGRRDTGAMINSMTHVVDMGKKQVHIGTNISYAVYHELGTGTYATSKKGRKGWWVYVAHNSGKKAKATGKIYTKEEALRIAAILRSKGLDARVTNGIKPIHFLKKAVDEHKDVYKEIAKKYLGG